MESGSLSDRLYRNFGRSHIFAVTWLAYAGFYLCRKNFSVTMPLLVEQVGWNKLQLANVLFGYSLMYCTWQFVNGYLSDRLGARLVVGAGLFIAIFSNLAMGMTASLGLMLVLNCINGAAQATGWSGLVKTMSAWYVPRERGVIMAWWSTNYALGGFLATLFATWSISQSVLLTKFTWQRGFWMPALLLAPIAILFVLLVRNHPPGASDTSAGSASPLHDSSNLGEILRNRVVWTISLSYFFVKATRYSFLFWLPLYLTERLRYEKSDAGYFSSIYELVGFTGVILAGYVSDRLMRSQRFPVVTMMLWCLAGLCFLHPMVASMGMMFNAIGVGLIGMMTFGPDTMIAGPAVQDAVSTRAAGTAAGFVNGVGSAGQLLSPYLVAVVADQFGWDRLFYLFGVFALISGAMLMSLWKTSQTPAPVEV